jgi:hypothetical protein
MNKTELQYKFDTGNSPIIEIKSDFMCYVDVDELEKAGREEILHELRKHTPQTLSIEIVKLPTNYTLASNARIPAPAYVKWLEEKLETLNIKL